MLSCLNGSKPNFLTGKTIAFFLKLLRQQSLGRVILPVGTCLGWSFLALEAIALSNLPATETVLLASEKGDAPSALSKAIAPPSSRFLWEDFDSAIAPQAVPQLAQVTPPRPDIPRPPVDTPPPRINREGTSPSLEPPPTPELPAPLPPPEDLLGPDFDPIPLPEISQPEDGITVEIREFDVVGSTVFSEEDFEKITAEYVDRPLTFDEVLEVRDQITALYVDQGYITSGAIVPPQQIQDGVATIQVVEGSIEDIVVEGTTRLKPSYVSSRIGLGVQTPLKIDTLLESLQLLQLNPIIENISADLQPGTEPGTNLLAVTVVEANTSDLSYILDNNRSPSVGSLENQLRFSEANLTGNGDALLLSYAMALGEPGIQIGSRELDVIYTVPVSPHNTTLTGYFSGTFSDVIEEPFDALEISSESYVGELTLRHPVIQTPTQELTLGLIASHLQSQTFLGFDDSGGFPLSLGADDEGLTKVTALRFLQEWTQRNTQQVISLRSQFNLGIGALDASISGDPDVPDSQFFSWLGQGQYVRSLAPDTLLILRGSVQLTPDFLLNLERYGLGGQATVRGYRQDILLSDNGAALSLEARFPLWRSPDRRTLVQITPFIDAGYGWNNRGVAPDPDTLIGVGAGLLMEMENASLRVDWGIPLTDQNIDANTLQEQGIYFTLNLSLL